MHEGRVTRIFNQDNQSLVFWAIFACTMHGPALKSRATGYGAYSQDFLFINHICLQVMKMMHFLKAFLLACCWWEVNGGKNWKTSSADCRDRRLSTCYVTTIVQELWYFIFLKACWWAFWQDKKWLHIVLLSSGGVGIQHTQNTYFERHDFVGPSCYHTTLFLWCFDWHSPFW